MRPWPHPLRWRPPTRPPICARRCRCSWRTRARGCCWPRSRRPRSRRVWLGGWSRWDLAPVAVIALLWPLQEWLIHVFILHAKPKRIGRFTFDGRVPRKHRAHHRDPWNYDLLFIPFHSFSYALPLLAALCYALTPSPRARAHGARDLSAARDPLRGGALPDPHARRAARRLLPAGSGAITGCTTSRTSTTGSA